MGEKELREKYGGKLAKAINRAIRAELPDGNAALDKLAKLSGKANSAGKETPDGKPPAVKAFEQQQKIVAAMEATIRQKYGIKPSRD